ncbi:conserved hypothetical protein [Methylocella tundrae]|nr:conserved hypothetical protein [Methylocella tundrae]
MASSITCRLTSSITSSIVWGIVIFMEQDKVRENRLRRAADRQGYRLVKSRSRDPRAVDFGRYALVDAQTGGAVNPALADRWTCSWTLDEVEAHLGGIEK